MRYITLCGHFEYVEKRFKHLLTIYIKINASLASIQSLQYYNRNCIHEYHLFCTHICVVSDCVHTGCPTRIHYFRAARV